MRETRRTEMLGEALLLTSANHEVRWEVYIVVAAARDCAKNRRKAWL